MMQMRLLPVLLLLSVLLGACGAPEPLYVPDVVQRAAELNGRDVTVSGAYLRRGAASDLSVLAMGVSTLPNGLDAQPLGDAIWIEGFPEPVIADLNRPGDAIYGFVQVSGRFESGAFGPGSAYPHRITISSASAINPAQRSEVRISNEALPAGKTSLFALVNTPDASNGQTVVTQGYYFWNSVIYVLAEGISVEEDGSNPQPIGRMIWMEGFPPDKSSELNLGPSNAFVWGKVEVTGAFQSGGNFGKDGAYPSQLTVNGPVTVLQP